MILLDPIVDNKTDSTLMTFWKKAFTFTKVTTEDTIKKNFEVREIKLLRTCNMNHLIKVDMFSGVLHVNLRSSIDLYSLSVLD